MRINNTRSKISNLIYEKSWIHNHNKKLKNRSHKNGKFISN
jgi:hypothetical protein